MNAPDTNERRFGVSEVSILKLPTRDLLEKSLRLLGKNGDIIHHLDKQNFVKKHSPYEVNFLR